MFLFQKAMRGEASTSKRFLPETVFDPCGMASEETKTDSAASVGTDDAIIKFTVVKCKSSIYFYRHVVLKPRKASSDGEEK
jgi:hypothetical protein